MSKSDLLKVIKNNTLCIIESHIDEIKIKMAYLSQKGFHLPLYCIQLMIKVEVLRSL
jgi:hypothetical protein